MLEPHRHNVLCACGAQRNEVRPQARSSRPVRVDLVPRLPDEPQMVSVPSETSKPRQMLLFVVILEKEELRGLRCPSEEAELEHLKTHPHQLDVLHQEETRTEA